MPDLHDVTTTIDDQSGSFGDGGELICVLSCVEKNANASAPRLYGSSKDLFAQHGYSPGLDFASHHLKSTRKPLMFIGLPTATAGAIVWKDSAGVTGTSTVDATVGPSGVLEEIDAIFTITTGGTVGTDGVIGLLSCDGGRTSRAVRLGTASSYTIPFFGVVLTFGAGTLVAGDVFAFATTAPLFDSTGLAAARAALALQKRKLTTWLCVGDLPDATLAASLVTQVNGYETENDRFVVARAQVRDKKIARMSRTRKKISGSPQLTFAEVGATGDTITRATGSWITDGFSVGDRVTITGTTSNNIVDGDVTAVTATILTFGNTDLNPEVITTGYQLFGSPALTFAEVGATGDTITRTSGSWITDGFAIGDTVEITGTSLNNRATADVTAVTATVLTLGTTDLDAEVIASHRVSVRRVETNAAYLATVGASFASIDAQRRVDLGVGRGYVESPWHQWQLRRPSSWAASVREYSQPIHVPTWRKADGPLGGWSLENGFGVVTEIDARNDAGALGGRFTCLRTWANGPEGAFVENSLTRATEGQLLSLTHNMHVANIACSVAQAACEDAIGQLLVLKTNGRPTAASLARITSRVNRALEEALLADVEGEGPRASAAVWTANPDANLSVVNATLDGVLDLKINGTIAKIATRVRVS